MDTIIKAIVIHGHKPTTINNNNLINLIFVAILILESIVIQSYICLLNKHWFQTTIVNPIPCVMVLNDILHCKVGIG